MTRRSGQKRRKQSQNVYSAGSMPIVTEQSKVSSSVRLLTQSGHLTDAAVWERLKLQLFSCHVSNERLDFIIVGENGIPDWWEKCRNEMEAFIGTRFYEEIEISQTSQARHITAQCLDYASHYSISLLSKNTCLSLGNVISMDENTLHFHLTKGTFETLGLPGHKLPFVDRFAVRLDTRNKSMQAGKKMYQRAMKCLAEAWHFPCRFKVICEKENEIVPNPFENVESKQFSLLAETRIIENVVLPCIEETLSKDAEIMKLLVSSSKDESIALKVADQQERVLLLHEWIGLVLHEMKPLLEQAKQDPYFCCYNGPEMRKNAVTDEPQRGPIVHFSVKGMMTSQTVTRLMDILYQHAGKECHSSDFIAAHVQGSRDAPVAWRRFKPATKRSLDQLRDKDLFGVRWRHPLDDAPSAYSFLWCPMTRAYITLKSVGMQVAS